MRPVLRAAAGTAVLSAVASAGWVGAVVLSVAGASVVGAICWVVNDAGRARRLNELLRTWRSRH